MNDHGEIRGLLHADRRERAESHQHLAIAGDHHDAALGLREREAEADHCRLPHRPPQRKAEIGIARGGDVPPVEPRPAITKRSFLLF